MGRLPASACYSRTCFVNFALDWDFRANSDEEKEMIPNIEIDPNMPEDEIRLVSGTSMVRMVNVGKPKAVKPTEIEKMPKGYSLSIDPCVGKDKTIVQIYDTKKNTLESEYSVSPLMRRLGFNRHP